LSLITRETVAIDTPLRVAMSFKEYFFKVAPL
jgi:hypothetical protein